MKKKILFMSMLASLLMTGCSQDEVVPVEGGGTDGNGETNTSYIAVNLVPSDVTGSRAATGYEDGTEEENAVTNVRFYFFNGLGGAVNVKLHNGSKVNYYDWIPANGDQTRPSDSDDIESKLKATIVINTEEGDEIPQRIAAVLNPNWEETSSKSLTDLKATVEDYATVDLTSNGKFVMFNSVGGDGKDFSSTLIGDKNLCKSKDDAIKNPVTIYVERSVAKVRVTLDKKLGINDNNLLALKDKDGEDLKIGNEQVYLKLEAWDLTAETDESRLVKKINPGWEGDWWHTSYRSFWAINSMTAKNNYYPYDDTGIVAQFGKENALYTNENAQQIDIDGSTKGSADKHTKFIIKGKLCKADGSAFTIVRHLGVYFADDNNQTNLKKSILNQLAANGSNFYYDETKVVGETSQTERKQIDVDDLQIVVVDQLLNEESDNNCYVCAQLTTTAAGKTWYESLTAESPIEKGGEVINDILKYKKKPAENKIDKALIWNSGMTYYYDEIKHLNNERGVVRNHIYEINLTKIAGLGTPVYDPTQVIYPEKPEGNNHYIAAEINILSWRVVNNDYPLVWD